MEGGAGGVSPSLILLGRNYRHSIYASTVPMYVDGYRHLVSAGSDPEFYNNG